MDLPYGLGYSDSGLAATSAHTVRNQQSDIRNQVAWLSLNKEDNDLTRFLTYLGAGLYELLGAIYGVAAPALPAPTTWDYIWAGGLVIVGLGGFFNAEIAFPLNLVLVSVVMVVNVLLRRD